jgi:hypothetical protein
MTAPILAALPSPADARDHAFSAYRIPVAVPSKVMPAEEWTVLNQGSTPACVGFSGALGEQVRMELVNQDKAVFSGPDLYAWCKAHDGDPNGEGTFVRIACKGLIEVGGLVTKVLQTPDGSIKIGSRVKINNYARLASIAEIKQAIADPAMGSVWMCSKWCDPWFTPHLNGVLPPPDSTLRYGHAYTFIGYDDSREAGAGAFLMQNSWGSGWGLGGRAWFPYSYITPLIGWEAWRTNIPHELGVPSSPEVPVQLLTQPVRLFDGPVPITTPQALQIAGVAGIPANAIGIVGTIRVVNPARPGWVYVGPDQGGVPSTSTLDFDTHITDGFPTVMLTDGKLTIYSTQAISRFVVDVSGYLAV